MLSVVFAFVLGGAAGYFYGRWRPATSERDASSPTPLLSRPTGEAGPPVLAKPNKRGRKAGLTEADFTPSDDILEKLRRAAEGELDPALLQDETHARAATPKAGPKPEAAANVAPAIDPLRMTDAERRVFDRLRRTEEEAPPAE